MRRLRCVGRKAKALGCSGSSASLQPGVALYSIQEKSNAKRQTDICLLRLVSFLFHDDRLTNLL